MPRYWEESCWLLSVTAQNQWELLDFTKWTEVTILRTYLKAVWASKERERKDESRAWAFAIATFEDLTWEFLSVSSENHWGKCSKWIWKEQVLEQMSGTSEQSGCY